MTCTGGQRTRVMRKMRARDARTGSSGGLLRCGLAFGRDLLLFVVLIIRQLGGGQLLIRHVLPVSQPKPNAAHRGVTAYGLGGSSGYRLAARSGAAAGSLHALPGVIFFLLRIFTNFK